VSVEIRNVTKRFTAGGTPAVADVNFTAPSGCITALLGPSGSGKSTVLRVIAGLEQPDTGQVIFEGVDYTSRPAQQRGVGFVFQSYALFKHMTVRRNVAFALNVRKVPKAAVATRVDELLSLVQLEGLGDRFPAQLSGGQRQRVAFARALAIEPRMLLLDEPFGALDALTRAKLQDELMNIVKAAGSTVLMVTHDVDEAVLLADRIVMLTNGPAATIGEILAIDLPRPRDRIELGENPQYHHYRTAVLEFLYRRQAHVEAAA